jgi:lipopolysaccharide transport system ATP-binding protein
VLFVSHNLAAVKSICNSGIVLENGQIKLIGAIDIILDVYNQQNTITEFKFENEEINLNFFKVQGQDNVEIFNISNGNNFCFKFSIDVKKHAPKIGFCIAVYNELGELITAINSYHLADKLNNLKCGAIVIEVHMPRYIFNTGVYSVNFHINDDSGNLFHILERVATFIVFDDGYRRGDKYAGTWPGKICLIPKISINEVF